MSYSFRWLFDPLDTGKGEKLTEKRIFSGRHSPQSRPDHPKSYRAPKRQVDSRFMER
jgi:hypothetical protein